MFQMQMMTGTQVTGSVNPPRLPALEEKLRRAMTKATSGERLVLAKFFRAQRPKKEGQAPGTTFRCSTKLAGKQALLHTAGR